MVSDEIRPDMSPTSTFICDVCGDEVEDALAHLAWHLSPEPGGEALA